MSADGNRGNGGQDQHVNQLVLTFDADSFRLHIGGHTENYDMALAMLDMARRDIEGKIRAAQAAQSLAMPLPGMRIQRGS